MPSIKAEGGTDSGLAGGARRYDTWGTGQMPSIKAEGGTDSGLAGGPDAYDTWGDRPNAIN